MTPVPHGMPGVMFDAVAAGGGGAAALELLARAEHSRRLACAYAVTRTAGELGGAVAGEAGRAWDLLDAATRADPVAAAAVLSHPAAGPALFGLLARLVREREGKTGEETVEGTGHGGPPIRWFTALAAAAAVRAGLPGQVEWPVDGDRVALPSLGRTRFPGARPGDRARLRVTADGRSLLSLTDASGTDTDGPVPVPARGYGGTGRWQGARLLDTLDGGAPLLLDVLDHPYFPNAAPHPADLGAEETRHWETVAREACALLRADLPQAYAELAAGPLLLVPLVSRGPGQVSGSSAEAFGCVALSPPATGTTFAVTLVHETQHNKLAALLHLFDLLEPSGAERFYAPWRPDPRPLLGLFHGAYAHLGVARFWNARRASEPDPALRATAHVLFARWRLAAREATLTVLASNRLTGLGERFAGQMLTALDALCALPVPAAARHRAESAAQAHHTAWRARNGTTLRVPAREG
ncbi:HEXXH motif-containing putative peptide modification protein [Streptomyces sp. NPDC007901]|uniref:aKG-HExxH-type peptide beta-hydroxylase n=1 Tax=Streptomyces sp. NPDC007901 TaxID=3364785 RepID=UPI0036E820B6